MGEELRRARERAQASIGVVSAELGWSPDRLTELEAGSRGAGDVDIAALLDRYGTDQAIRERILAIAAEPDTGTFVRVHDLCVDALTTVRLHERRARTVTTYDPVGMPDLAQTQDYTAALTGDRDIARIRAARTRELHAHTPRGCGVVIYLHETALHLVVGDRTVVHEQLLHLVALTDLPGLTVRVIPMKRAGQTALRRPATMLTFDAPLRPMVYSDTDNATVVHDDPAVVGDYRDRISAVAELALDARDTRDLIACRAISLKEHTPVPLRLAPRHEPGDGGAPRTAGER
ncbi:helix-turn-helix domain-containing protein [Actinosynnema sp. NPDC059797]